MKVVFAGPSLYGSTKLIDTSVMLLPPAAQGDIAAAVHRGATVIGIIDGVYENVAAIWHKEILFAISQGVRVFGGASLGALRAVECAPFGMVGVGRIYQAYRDGVLVDDSDLAILHAPPELGYRPLTNALVDVRSTIEFHLAHGRISPEEGQCLLQSAEGVFFKDRTWKTILDKADFPPSRHHELRVLFAEQPVQQKRLDAEMLIEYVIAAGEIRDTPPTHWQLHKTPFL